MSKRESFGVGNREVSQALQMLNFARKLPAGMGIVVVIGFLGFMWWSNQSPQTPEKSIPPKTPTTAVHGDAEVAVDETQQQDDSSRFRYHEGQTERGLTENDQPLSRVRPGNSTDGTDSDENLSEQTEPNQPPSDVLVAEIPRQQKGKTDPARKLISPQTESRSARRSDASPQAKPQPPPAQSKSSAPATREQKSGKDSKSASSSNSRNTPQPNPNAQKEKGVNLGKNSPTKKQDVENRPTLIQNVTLRNQDGKTIYQGDIDLQPTIDRIERGERHAHRNDGSVFQNRENRLSRKPSGYYREYVVPTPDLSGPGPQRLILGNGGEVYYTHDHYRSFRRINITVSVPDSE